jgi:uncharacterized membrane protein YqhA
MNLVARTRYVALLGVACSFAASLVAFAWTGVKLVRAASHMLQGETEGQLVALVQVMDATLIAAGLLIFAFGLYQLFIGQIEAPEGLAIDSLDALKARLAGIVVLVLAVEFLRRLETGIAPLELVYTALAIALVSAALIALARTAR